MPRPSPRRWRRGGSGDKPILRFVLPAEILQSNQIAERLIKIPIPREPARRYGFGLRVQVSFDTRSEREAARSAARELEAWQSRQCDEGRGRCVVGQKPHKASTQASGMGQSHVRCLPQITLSLTLRIWLITGSDLVTVGRSECLYRNIKYL